jgi:Spy/CpxP family protein refolding chaperone
MKRNLLILTLVVMMSLAAALPALADDPGWDPAPGSTCGQAFGEHHAEHAQAGELSQDHNPGHHQGLAGFLEHHDGEEICP